MRRIITSGSAIGKGVNLISQGNDYHEYQNQTTLDGLLRGFVADGLSYLSVRVIWAVAEPDAGNYDNGLIDNVRFVVGRARATGLRVMLDFHTLFGEDAGQNWTYPSWASGSGSIEIARNASVRASFMAMQAYVVGRIGAGVQVVSVLNEPWGAVSTDRAKIDTALASVADGMRGRGVEVAVRFATGWSFTAARSSQRFDSANASKFDVIGMNVYLDPALSDGYVKPDDGASWGEVWGAAVLRRMWITEFGSDTTNDTAQANYYAAALRRFGEAPEVRLAWMYQTTDDGDNFNIRGRPAYTTFTRG